MRQLFKNLLIVLALLCGVPAQAASAETERAAVEAVKRAFSRAVSANDLAAIGQHLAPDWRVIEVGGQTISREDYLGVISEGLLKYESLEGRDLDIRIYGDTAVITGHALAKGTFDGTPFSSDEISSEILVRKEGTWQFVLTHLTTFKK
jgi:ketosteroid isomerase-like protein